MNKQELKELCKNDEVVSMFADRLQSDSDLCAHVFELLVENIGVEPMPRSALILLNEIEEVNAIASPVMSFDRPGTQKCVNSVVSDINELLEGAA